MQTFTCNTWPENMVLNTATDISPTYSRTSRDRLQDVNCPGFPFNRCRDISLLSTKEWNMICKHHIICEVFLQILQACALFYFAKFWCSYIMSYNWFHVIHFLIYFRFGSLVLEQLYDWPCEVTLKDMAKMDQGSFQKHLWALKSKSS